MTNLAFSNRSALPDTNWNYPSQILFGSGRISEVSNLCEQLNIHTPLIVTDQGLANFDFIKALQSQLANAHIYSHIKANPNGKNISDGVAEFKHGHHDGVIAIGGGSAIDAGKAIALMVGQSRPIWDFEDSGDNWKRVNVEAMAPVIAIPTTAGTGAEVGRTSVIVDIDTETKKLIFHPNMQPTHVILDPELTSGLPAHITSATGVDAFVHCLEAYCAPGFHPMADGIAMQGMQLIKQWLPIACEDGNNLEARGNMLVASTMGATAFQKGLGAVHALAHPLGAIYDKHHGLLNAILLPYVVAKNKHAIEDKIKTLCPLLDLSPNFDEFLNWVMQFRRQLGIPNSLADIALNTDRAELIGQMASADPSAASNPILFSQKEYTDIFKHAVNGTDIWMMFEDHTHKR